MSTIKLDKGAIVVVCDGSKAVILENTGDAHFPNLRMKEAFEHGNKPTHELGTAPPGRSHQSIGHHRSAVEQTDWHDEAERSFLHKLASRLDAVLAERKVPSMTVVAPPRALGILRAVYSSSVRQAVAHEIAKDLVKLPIHAIESALITKA